MTTPVTVQTEATSQVRPPKTCQLLSYNANVVHQAPEPVPTPSSIARTKATLEHTSQVPESMTDCVVSNVFKYLFNIS